LQLGVAQEAAQGLQQQLQCRVQLVVGAYLVAEPVCIAERWRRLVVWPPVLLLPQRPLQEIVEIGTAAPPQGGGG